jgi:hypothetical protein
LPSSLIYPIMVYTLSWQDPDIIVVLDKILLFDVSSDSMLEYLWGVMIKLAVPSSMVKTEKRI